MENIYIPFLQVVSLDKLFNGVCIFLFFKEFFTNEIILKSFIRIKIFRELI